VSESPGLSSSHKKYLKGLAHDLSPVVRVGRAALSVGVIAETEKALESHELIKIRIDLDGGAERRELAKELADRTSSDLVSTIGKVAILYRRRSEDPTIKLPAA
jgi:RNA-binding protein